MGNFYLSAALTASMTLLVGCGGGDSANTTSPDKGGVVATKIVFDALGRFPPECGRVNRPLADVKLLAHTVDGKTIKTFTTDATGHIEAEWPQNARHFTVIYKSLNGNYFIDAVLDAANTDFGRFTYAVEPLAGECQCTDLKVNWQDIRASIPEYQLTLTGELQNLLRAGAGMETYRVCKDQQGRYGKLQAMLMPTTSGPSYMMEADINTLVANPDVNLNLAQFKQAGREISVTTNASVNDMSINNIRTFTPTQFGRAYSTSVSARATPRVFEVEGVKSAVGVNFGNTFTGFYNYGTERIALDKTDSDVIINLPTNQLEVLQAIQKAIGNASDIGGMDYDFSFLTNYSQASFILESNKIAIGFYGPMKAKIPDFEWPQDVLALMGNSDFSLEVSFNGINPAWDYKTYNQKVVQRSRDPSLESKDPSLLPYHFYSFDFDDPVSF